MQIWKLLGASTPPCHAIMRLYMPAPPSAAMYPTAPVSVLRPVQSSPLATDRHRSRARNDLNVPEAPKIMPMLSAGIRFLTNHLMFLVLSPSWAIVFQYAATFSGSSGLGAYFSAPCTMRTRSGPNRSRHRSRSSPSSGGLEASMTDRSRLTVAPCFSPLATKLADSFISGSWYDRWSRSGLMMALNSSTASPTPSGLGLGAATPVLMISRLRPKVLTASARE